MRQSAKLGNSRPLAYPFEACADHPKVTGHLIAKKSRAHSDPRENSAQDRYLPNAVGLCLIYKAWLQPSQQVQVPTLHSLNHEAVKLGGSPTEAVRTGHGMSVGLVGARDENGSS